MRRAPATVTVTVRGAAHYALSALAGAPAAIALARPFFLGGWRRLDDAEVYRERQLQALSKVTPL